MRAAPSRCRAPAAASDWRARRPSSARAFLVGGGAVYLLLFLYGLVVDKDSQANFVPLNTADNWLHLLLAIGMIGLGLALSRSPVHANRPVDRNR